MDHTERRVLHELFWMAEHAKGAGTAAVRRDVGPPVDPRDYDGGDQRRDTGEQESEERGFSCAHEAAT